MERFFLGANSEVIKGLIERYRSGQLTAIYGNAGSGKSTVCTLAAIEAAKSGKAIYVDCDNTFSSERAMQLYPHKKTLENILVLKPRDFEEQHATLLALKQKASENIGLIIVDTISHHYRKTLNEQPKKTNSMMAEQLADLVRLARDKNKVILIANQVYTEMDSDSLRMVGHSLVRKMCKTIIELRKEEDVRTATLVKQDLPNNTSHYRLGKMIRYEIKEKGLFRCEVL